MRAAADIPRDTLSASRPPPGAHADQTGVMFALFSGVAEAVEVCLFDPSGHEIRHELRVQEGSVWAAHVDGVLPGRRYGFRVHGPWDPSRGLRCNPAKLLLDPYARAIDGDVRWHPAVYGHPPALPTSATTWTRRPTSRARSCVRRDSTGATTGRRASRCRTRSSTSSTSRALPNGIPTSRPRCAAPMPAWGIRSPSTISSGSGVTAVELLPVHQFVHDASLVARGLRNYWGYQPVGFFAPHHAYASGRPRRAGRRVQGDGQGAARRRARGHPRRRLQPHRRGRRRRSHPEPARGRQRRLLPPAG